VNLEKLQEFLPSLLLLLLHPVHLLGFKRLLFLSHIEQEQQGS
jgi:hypothetical protein